MKTVLLISVGIVFLTAILVVVFKILAGKNMRYSIVTFIPHEETFTKLSTIAGFAGIMLLVVLWSGYLIYLINLGYHHMFGFENAPLLTAIIGIICIVVIFAFICGVVLIKDYDILSDNPITMIAPIVILMIFVIAMFGGLFFVTGSIHEVSIDCEIYLEQDTKTIICDDNDSVYVTSIINNILKEMKENGESHFKGTIKLRYFCYAHFFVDECNCTEQGVCKGCKKAGILSYEVE